MVSRIRERRLELLAMTRECPTGAENIAQRPTAGAERTAHVKLYSREHWVDLIVVHTLC